MTISDLQGIAKLSNGVEMPYFGLGVYQAPESNASVKAFEFALETGYRHIDTASLYQNEKSVGEAIRRSGIKREDIFVTTKVWNSDQGFSSTMNAFQKSLDSLQLNYIDLYLIHWPVHDKYIDTWKALEVLYKKKAVRAIGVSNFNHEHLEDLMSCSEIVPMVNQVEFHPFLLQTQLRQFCLRNEIQFEAWAPLMRGKVNDIPDIQKIAKKYGKTPAQIILRWDLQKGIITIPKSVRNDRIKSNAEIFDFNLFEKDMAIIDSLEINHRIGPDPDNFSF
jgi:methylglyoxal/glyoxal reductase